MLSLITSLALSTAAAQAPVSHADALRCESTFLVGAVLLAANAEESGDPGDQERARIVYVMAERANADRTAAARREGLDLEESNARVNAHISANMDIRSEAWGQAFLDCAELYAEGLLDE